MKTIKSFAKLASCFLFGRAFVPIAIEGDVVEIVIFIILFIFVMIVFSIKDEDDD